jgi:AraC family transcriptional regulator of adaptative response/methylated-DNA-[protein]-cysteine methyltransferase
MNDYQRIAAAIEFIHQNFAAQPDLEAIAAHIHVSPFHFQKLFKEWAGVSPKKFLQYTSLQHAKSLLEQNHTVADAAFETGLSGTGRLHDLFVRIEGMTPGEYRNGGASLTILYNLVQSPFGLLFVAATGKGICNIFFTEDEISGVAELKKLWPNAIVKMGKDVQQQYVQAFFNDDWSNLHQIKLHLKGTPFQMKVWEALLKVPAGRLATYSSVAASVGSPKASRAVGTAVGDNPVAYLIPCHRVIRATGVLGGYHWGATRKAAIIGWESGKTYGEAI